MRLSEGSKAEGRVDTTLNDSRLASAWGISGTTRRLGGWRKRRGEEVRSNRQVESDHVGPFRACRAFITLNEVGSLWKETSRGVT